MAKMTMVQALNLALRQEMEKDDRVIVLGEDVGVDGGVFRVTDGLIDRFGGERVLDTPLAENGIVGMSIGMAVYGLKPVCEIQFSGFSYQNFHQIENHAARLRWRSRGRYQVPMVLRTPYGGGVRALEHHSESREAYWAHTPGIKTVIPSGPRNARGLLVSAMRDPDPVIFYESKALYRSFREEVPEEEETVPIGKPRIVREGKDLTMIAYGAMMRPTLEAAASLKEKDGVALGFGKAAAFVLAGGDQLCQGFVQKAGGRFLHRARITLRVLYRPGPPQNVQRVHGRCFGEVSTHVTHARGQLRQDG